MNEGKQPFMITFGRGRGDCFSHINAGYYCVFLLLLLSYGSSSSCCFCCYCAFIVVLFLMCCYRVVVAIDADF